MLTTESALRKDRTTGKADLQHRHYATIAVILRDMPEDNQKAAHRMLTKEFIIEYFADELRHTNAKFDRKRFLAACK